MSDAFWLAIITAVPTTLAALGALIVSIRTGRKTDVVAAKVEAVDAKAIEIHSLTNSNLSAVRTALEVANTKIDGLKAQVAVMAIAKMDADSAKAIADKVIKDAEK